MRPLKLDRLVSFVYRFGALARCSRSSSPWPGSRPRKYAAVPEILVSRLKLLFWFRRELGWWWTIIVMLAFLVDFLRVAPVALWLSSRFGGGVVAAR
jgi:hypothetical protein